MTEQLQRHVRFLKLYALGMTVVVGILVVSSFAAAGAPSFEEIDVERINIVEADGTLRMVISNKARQHPGISHGDTISRDGPREPGILFFNHVGDEMGGLMYGANGEQGHWGQLTFDRFGGDQTIGVRHLEGDDGRYMAAIQLWQQPKLTPDIVARFAALDTMTDPTARRDTLRDMRARGELGVSRLFLGKGRDDVVLLELSDALGRGRVRMAVPATGEPHLEFLDSEGNVTSRLP